MRALKAILEANTPQDTPRPVFTETAIRAVSTALFMLRTQGQNALDETDRPEMQQFRNHLPNVAPLLCKLLPSGEIGEWDVVTIARSLSELAEKGILGARADCPSRTIVDTLLPHYRSMSRAQFSPPGYGQKSREGSHSHLSGVQGAIIEILSQLDKFQRIVSAETRGVSSPEDEENIGTSSAGYRFDMTGVRS